MLILGVSRVSLGTGGRVDVIGGSLEEGRANITV